MEDEVVSDAERLSISYPNATYDFYGTPSGALCVYKNGDAWPVRTGSESQRIIREARAVYDHPIKDTWRAVGERIYALLDDKKVLWTSIDPLAFAEAGKKTFGSLLLWIGVELASLLHEDANTAAEAVTFFLAGAGLKGIEIGFRESIVTRSVSGPKMLGFNPFFDPVPELRKPFTPTLGLSVAPLKTPHFEDIGALYLRESKESDRVFLLTCAHVSHPREQVIALGNVGYNNAVQSMIATIGDHERSIGYWEGIREEHLALIEKTKKTIEKTDKFHNEITKRWTIPYQRIIGEVVHVEPLSYTRDWVLIELSNDKFDWDTFKSNKVYVGGNISPLDYGKIMFPHPEDQAGYTYPQDGLLQAFGVVQAHEIHNPQHLDANGEKCLFVVKNGLTTGTTAGRATGMGSFTRVYNEYDIKETSIEIAVLPYGNTDGPFSAPGDSGSIVLTRDDRIFGMLTSGAGTTERTDVTHLTPYWYIEEEIKKMFPGCHLYEVVE
ncbi:hypothetical protein K488DRAFT_89938 [Vararia minispora EC-137]|uniref:Uncharacterized protein n=1 Tax=Vararia minispora EC-137 TaxID=1314806 RepID=A0ACB8Q937_9AGAM|nr:hypothetical protein K488DRAFT_89938 [Vararia minispora EC-137]